MNWDALGAIAERVGAVGVVVSLLALSSQMKGPSRALEAQRNHAVANLTEYRLVAVAQSS